MKIKFFGNGHVWDPGNNKTLCSFVGGEYSTDKDEEIDILRKCKFREEVVEAPALAPIAEEFPAPALPPVAKVVASEPSVVRKDLEVPVEADAPDPAEVIETENSGGALRVTIEGTLSGEPVLHQPKVVRKNLRKGY